MNFFSSEPFLGAVAASFFPRRLCRMTLVEVSGRVFRVLRVGRAQLAHDVRFLDYLEALPDSGGREPALNARFLRRVCHGVVPAERWEDLRTKDTLAAPLVRWARYPSFEDYVAAVEDRSKSCFKTAARKARKLEREVGALRFEPEAPDEEKVLRSLFAWKSDQYRRTKLPDLFASPATRALFRHLLRMRAIQLAALYAGERLVAAHAGPRLAGRFYHWVPAYDPDPELARYSAGNVLNHELMRASHAAGDHTFDMLLGDEDYKWRYATHVAVVGPLGLAPGLERAWLRVREVAAAPARQLPSVEAALRAAKRTLRERALLR